MATWPRNADSSVPPATLHPGSSPGNGVVRSPGTFVHSPPVRTQPAFRHGWDAESEQNAVATVELLRPVMPANLLGLPAAATPGGLVDGMPIGVQCMAAPFRDDRALDAAEVIQAAVGRLVPVDPFVNGR